jgi:hypothetical protein
VTSAPDMQERRSRLSTSSNERTLLQGFLPFSQRPWKTEPFVTRAAWDISSASQRGQCIEEAVNVTHFWLQFSIN